MKYLKNALFIASFLLLGFSSSIAQVKYNLQLLEDGKTYQVSILPEVSYASPLNITSTAQVTIKVPSGNFILTNFENLQPGVDWEANSLTQSPEEAPQYDYISFSLLSQGTSGISYEQGVEIPVFTFQNTGECGGEISLMNNQSDPFSPPNSRQVNVGNQITVFGAQGDAYAGIVSPTPIPCNNSTNYASINKELIKFRLFPNPVKNELNVELSWPKTTETAQLQVTNVLGKVLSSKELTLNSGINRELINVSSFTHGTYYIQLTGKDWEITSDKFVK